MKWYLRLVVSNLLNDWSVIEVYVGLIEKYAMSCLSITYFSYSYKLKCNAYMTLSPEYTTCQRAPASSALRSCQGKTIFAS